MGLKIRAATVLDAPDLGRLHGQCWNETYRGMIADAEIDKKIASAPAKWEAVLADPGSTMVWLAHVDGELAGFISVDAKGPGFPRSLEVCCLYILAKFHGQGVGSALMDFAISDTPAFLWCIEGNEKAERFYESKGFVAGEKKLWEAAGVNDVLYVR